MDQQAHEEGRPLRSAHAVSLPLFALLQRLSPKTIEEVVDDVREGLKKLELTGDLEMRIDVDPATERSDIIFLPKTRFGRQVLSDLKERASYPPCPKDQCQFDGSGACKWCGQLKC